LPNPVKLLLCACLLAGPGPFLGAAGPNHLRVGFPETSFVDLAMQDVRPALTIWANEISSNLKGVDGVSTSIFASTDALVAAMGQGEVDLAVLPILDYFQIETRVKNDLGFVANHGSSGAQRYFLVVQAGLPARALRDLRRLRFCHVKKDALGLLYLNHALLKDKLPEVDGFFGEVEAKAKGAQAVTNVYFGRADAALVTEDAYRTTVAMNPQVERKVRILLMSARMHSGLAFFRKGMSPALRTRVLEAVNHLKNLPRSAQILTLFGAAEVSAATEADLAEARRIYREYRAMKGRFQ